MATTAKPKSKRGTPPTLLEQPVQLSLMIAGIIALVLIGLFLPGLGLMSTVTTIFTFIILAQGWNILGGYGGYLNLGMAVFFGLGAYTTAIMVNRELIPPIIAVPLAGVVGTAFALLIGLPSLRLRGPYFTILTLIIGFLVQQLVLNADFTRGALGILIDPLPLQPRGIEQVFYFTYLVLMIASVYLVYRIENSKFGYALVAIREDEEAAAVLGVKTTQVKMYAFMLGAFMGGMVGGIHSYRIGYVEPLGIFSLTLSINVVLMTVVGGSGTWQGPLIGVPLITLISEVLRVGITRIDRFGISIPLETNRVVFGIILVLVALFAQQGIMGLFKRVRSRRFSV